MKLLLCTVCYFQKSDLMLFFLFVTVTFSRIDPGGKLVMGFRKATNNADAQVKLLVILFHVVIFYFLFFGVCVLTY